jgi:hypothetical protein
MTTTSAPVSFSVSSVDAYPASSFLYAFLATLSFAVLYHRMIIGRATDYDHIGMFFLCDELERIGAPLIALPVLSA